MRKIWEALGTMVVTAFALFLLFQLIKPFVPLIVIVLLVFFVGSRLYYRARRG